MTIDEDTSPDSEDVTETAIRNSGSSVRLAGVLAGLGSGKPKFDDIFRIQESLHRADEDSGRSWL